MKPQRPLSTTAHPFAALRVLTSILALVVLAGCGGAADPPDREQLVPKGMRRTTVTAQDAGTRVTTATETATPAAAPPEVETPAAAVTPEPPTVAPPDDGQASVAPAPAEVPAAAASPGSWTVQAGAFTRAETAAGVADTLRRAGIAATVETADVGGISYRRVVVNGLADRAAAEALVARLKGEFAMNALVRGTHAAEH